MDLSPGDVLYPSHGNWITELNRNAQAPSQAGLDDTRALNPPRDLQAWVSGEPRAPPLACSATFHKRSAHSPRNTLVLQHLSQHKARSNRQQQHVLHRNRFDDRCCRIGCHCTYDRRWWNATSILPFRPCSAHRRRLHSSNPRCLRAAGAPNDEAHRRTSHPVAEPERGGCGPRAEHERIPPSGIGAEPGICPRHRRRVSQGHHGAKPGCCEPQPSAGTTLARPALDDPNG